MNNKFTQWCQLFECKTLTGNQRVILGIILNLHNIEGWDFTPLSVLEERSGFTRPTIIKNLNELVAKGLLNKSMNKSRQTNGIPPNDYVPIYDNIHNLLNSQRLKNFTFSQQKELKNFTPKRLKNFTKEEKKRKKDIVKRVKENIKEKRESNEMINGKLNRKDEVKEKQSNNNMNFNKNGMYMELNSHPTVQSKDWTKGAKEEKTHSSSAGTTKVIQIGDTRYAVETANTDSSIWDSFPGGTASRENNKAQRVTTTEDHKDNTLSNASLHNENEDNPNEDKPTTAGQNTNSKTAEYNHEAAGTTETAHRGFNGAHVDNYSTHTKKTSQERNNEGNRDTHNPMNGYIPIDELEDIYNGGNPTPTQPISKVRSQTTSKAKSNEGGGGRKFTPRKEWDIAMRVVLQHINNSSDMYNKLTTDDVNILYEGASDKYRVIETIKAIQLMLTYRMKFPTYQYLLNDAIDTLEANEEAYTPKQYEYACEIYDDCVDRYEKITNNK